MEFSNTASANASQLKETKPWVSFQQLWFSEGQASWDQRWLRRWARAGYPVIVGSHTAHRAIEAAAGIGWQVRGAENVEA
jgi:hypothetical protein